MIFFDDFDKIAILNITRDNGVQEAIDINKEKDRLIDVFEKLKINFKQHFFLGGGDIIEKEEYQKNIGQLSKKLVEDDDNNIHLLMENINNDEDKLIEEEDINNKNNNIISGESQNDEKISNYNNPNEKILDINHDNEEKTDIKRIDEINVKDNNNKIEYISYTSFRYNLQKANDYICFIFFLFFYFFFIFGNIIHTKDFKSFGGTIWIFIISLIFLLVISIIIFFCFEKKIKKSQTICLYIFYIFYLFVIIFYLILLSNFIQYKYIALMLLLVCLDFGFIELYFRTYEEDHLLFTISPLLLSNIIVISIYSYFFKEESNIIRNITCLAVGIIVYITIMNYITLAFQIDEIIHCQCFLLYGIFIFIDFIIICYLLCLCGIFLAIKESCKKKI